MARRKEPVIPDAILDQLLAGADAKTAFDQNGLLDQLKKALTERALKAELDHHLAGDESGNRCNGYGRKTVLTEGGSMELSIPRDRTGTFDPALIAKYQRRFPGFDEKIVSMYARGMSTREITGHLREFYGIEVSADLISTVTDAVIEEVTTWQNRNDAVPASSAALLTLVMLVDTSCVPSAACWKFRPISLVAADCSSTADAMLLDISFTRVMIWPMVPIAPTATLVWAWISEIWADISSVVLAVWLVSCFTSLATTAKPLPASPTRAASMVALRAGRSV